MLPVIPSTYREAQTAAVVTPDLRLDLGPPGEIPHHWAAVGVECVQLLSLPIACQQ